MKTAGGKKHSSIENPFHQVRSSMFSFWERVNAKNQSSKLKGIIMDYEAVFPGVDFEVQGEAWNQDLVLDRMNWAKKKSGFHF